MIRKIGYEGCRPNFVAQIDSNSVAELVYYCYLTMFQVVVRNETLDSDRAPSWSNPRRPEISKECRRKSQENKSGSRIPETHKRKPQWVDLDLSERGTRPKSRSPIPGKSFVKRPKPRSSEIKQREDLGRHLQQPSEHPPCAFVQETNYFAKPRRIPWISDAESHSKHRELHDLNFIGWGDALRDDKS